MLTWRQVNSASMMRWMVACAALYLAGWAPSGNPPAFSAVADRPAMSAAAAQEQLQAAIKAGDLGRMRSLIDAGVDVNAADKDGNTPLMLTAGVQNVEAVRLLLAAHANVNARNATGYTPLLMSFAKGDLVLVYLKYLVPGLVEQAVKPFSGPSPEEKAAMLKGAYAKAAESDSIDVVKLLLAAKADVNAADDNGRTALAAASFHGNARMVAVLLAAGANVDARHYDGSTALMDAVDADSVEVVRALLMAKADVNARREDGFTVLMLAAQAGNAEIVRSLLSAKPNVNARGSEGETALSLALQNRHAQAAALLQRAGAKEF